MKKLIIIHLIGFLYLGTVVNAQSVDPFSKPSSSSSSSNSGSSLTIDASQNITNFSFKGSDGVVDKEYNPNYSGSFSVGYRNILPSGVILRGSLGMRNAGATLVVDDTNNTYNYQYAEAKIGAGYLYSLGKIGVYLTVSPYFGYLLKANQNLLNEDYDIINHESTERIDYGVFASPGVNFEMSEFISAYFELNVMRGLANLETVETQTSNNTLIGGSLGLAFTIK